MDYPDFLKFARDKWANDSSLIAKRNLAYAHLKLATYFSYGINIRELSWIHINFTLKVVRNPLTFREIELTQSCIDALNAWLEGVWALHNQTNLWMRGGVFFNNYILDHMETDIERQIQSLDLTDSQESEIINQYESFRQQRINTEKIRKYAKKHAKAKEIQRFRDLVNRPRPYEPTKTTPVLEVKDDPQRLKQAWEYDKTVKSKNSFPMRQFWYRRRDIERIEQEILDYGYIAAMRVA